MVALIKFVVIAGAILGWFAPHDVRGGKELFKQIDEAIRVHEKVLLILSAKSMKSEWVKTEIARARKREVRGEEGTMKRAPTQNAPGSRDHCPNRCY